MKFYCLLQNTVIGIVICSLPELCRIQHIFSIMQLNVELVLSQEVGTLPLIS